MNANLFAACLMYVIVLGMYGVGVVLCPKMARVPNDQYSEAG